MKFLTAVAILMVGVQSLFASPIYESNTVSIAVLSSQYDTIIGVQECRELWFYAISSDGSAFSLDGLSAKYYWNDEPYAASVDSMTNITGTVSSNKITFIPTPTTFTSLIEGGYSEIIVTDTNGYDIVLSRGKHNTVAAPGITVTTPFEADIIVNWTNFTFTNTYASGPVLIRWGSAYGVETNANGSITYTINTNAEASYATAAQGVAATNALAQLAIETNRAVQAEGLLYPYSNPSNYLTAAQITNTIADNQTFGATMYGWGSTTSDVAGAYVLTRVIPTNGLQTITTLGVTNNQIVASFITATGHRIGSIAQGIHNTRVHASKSANGETSLRANLHITDSNGVSITEIVGTSLSDVLTTSSALYQPPIATESNITVDVAGGQRIRVDVVANVTSGSPDIYIYSENDEDFILTISVPSALFATDLELTTHEALTTTAHGGTGAWDTAGMSTDAERIASTNAMESEITGRGYLTDASTWSGYAATQLISRTFDGYRVTGTLTPDATGLYGYIGDKDGQPKYKHIMKDYWLAYVSGDEYYLSDNVSFTGPGSGGVFWAGTNGTTITGNYDPDGTVTGTATVAAETFTSSYGTAYDGAFHVIHDGETNTPLYLAAGSGQPLTDDLYMDKDGEINVYVGGASGNDTGSIRLAAEGKTVRHRMGDYNGNLRINASGDARIFMSNDEVYGVADPTDGEMLGDRDYCDSRFVNTNEANSVTGSMVVDRTLGTNDMSAAAVAALLDDTDTCDLDTSTGDGNGNFTNAVKAAQSSSGGSGYQRIGYSPYSVDLITAALTIGTYTNALGVDFPFVAQDSTGDEYFGDNAGFICADAVTQLVHIVTGYGASAEATTNYLRYAANRASSWTVLTNTFTSTTATGDYHFTNSVSWSAGDIIIWQQNTDTASGDWRNESNLFELR